MNIFEAQEIIQEYYQSQNHTEEEEFIFFEALTFLIEETKDPKYMIDAGGYFYRQRKFELAQKYYEMAESYDYEIAYECLGYIWYYGRTGMPDYEKAFHYFSKSAEKGNLVSQYKVADMYKNGYYVQKDNKKYKDIVSSLVNKVKNCTNVFDPLPEVYTRYARICFEEEDISKGIYYYLIAKDFQAQRLMYTRFFGDLNIMKWLIQDLYKYKELDLEDIDLFDLFYVLLKPCTITFEYEEETYTIQAIEEERNVVISFLGKWYKDVDDFFKKACIENTPISTLYLDTYFFEVFNYGE
ncbi:MAG: sel1 repeat family protein [Firmicutes bacterium]|nr:sel1 repeat family protein [Bacillota bacterium]